LGILPKAAPDRSLSLFTRVGTYVQLGSKFCFVVLVLGADTFIKILQYCPISPCFQTCNGNMDLPGSLCLAALPGQPCPVALPGSLARQPCRKVCKLFYGRRPACMQYCILLLGRQFSSSFPISRNLRHCDFEPCVRIDIDLWTRIMTEVIFQSCLVNNQTFMFSIVIENVFMYYQVNVLVRFPGAGKISNLTKPY
jgi:hypothetical protein